MKTKNIGKCRLTYSNQSLDQRTELIVDFLFSAKAPYISFLVTGRHALVHIIRNSGYLKRPDNWYILSFFCFYIS